VWACASDTPEPPSEDIRHAFFREEQYVQQHGSGAQPWGAYPPCIAAISRREAHLQVGIVSTLESHWVVLDAELSEIRKDFGALRTVRARKTHSLDASGRQELPPETAHAPCATPCGGRQRRARTVMVAESRRFWCH